MENAPGSAPGRPRQASREFLQEAAFELFQLQGYQATTVEQIAKTAGVSRATFFNYFSSKAELFWVETDRLIERLGVQLTAEAAAEEPPSVHSALLSFAESLHSSDIPWALKNSQQLGSAEDLAASGAGRLLHVTGLLESYLEVTEAETPPVLRRGRALSLTGLLLTALLSWAEAGVSRDSAAHYLRELLTVLAEPA